MADRVQNKEYQGRRDSLDMNRRYQRERRMSKGAGLAYAIFRRGYSSSLISGPENRK
jgi:hypothetical protein